MRTTTRSELTTGLRALGVKPGGVLMVHTRMSAFGWIAGGSETVVSALLDVLGPDGTLMAYASWDEHVYRPEDRPEPRRAAYAADPPAFDPATAAVDPSYGRVPERIRTWPGARRSDHPEAGVTAVGPLARQLTENHPQEDSYGPDSPFARLVGENGQVLMLGAPLDAVTLLHHAEAIARVPGKRMVTYDIEIAGAPTRTYTDIDTSGDVLPYDQREDAFITIATAALTTGIGTKDEIAGATCHLFPAAELTAFAVAWIEERFQPDQEPR